MVRARFEATSERGRRETALLLVAGAAIATASAAVRATLPDRALESPVVHAAIEAAGALVALHVALLSAFLHGEPSRQHLRRFRACAFAAMGTLDVFHACAPPGDLFVWFRATATAAGGALFALAWLPPPAATSRALRALPLATGAAAVAFGVGSIAWRAHLPPMIDGDAFTFAPRMLNAIGGLGFVAALLRLVRSERRTPSTEDLLFAAQCLLLAFAAAAFPTSRIWRPDWWWWHALRLVAYAVALAYLLLAYRRADRALAEANAALRDAVRLRDDFLSIASHELKTPLTPLYLRLQAASRGLRQGRGVDERALDAAIAGVQRLTSLINDLLDVSRIDVGKLALRREPTDLVPIVRAQVEATQTSAREHAVTLEAIEPQLVVEGDASRLEQVVANLLDNAVKYTPPGGAIRVALSTRDGRALLAVSDTGIGVPEGERARLFERYFRTERAQRERAGLGLGLYICRDIVERHGGTIWAEGAPGGGSTFFVALPVLGAPREAAPPGQGGST